MAVGDVTQRGREAGDPGPVRLQRTKGQRGDPGAARTPCGSQSPCARNVPAETRDNEVKLFAQTQRLDVFLGTLPSYP